MNETIPLIVEFTPGSRIRQEEEVVSELPIIQNGPPGTFVEFENGRQIALPTDQIVAHEDKSSGASVGFGGMSFEGMEGDHLVFWRVKDLWPEEKLSPERGIKMTLDPQVVSKIVLQGTEVWPRTKTPKDN